MRRIVLFLSGTVTVVTLLFGYHTSTAGGLYQAAVAVDSSSSTAATSGNTATGGTSSGSAGTSGSAGGSGGDSSSTRTVTGPTVQTQWGPVQVQLTVSGGTITDVSVLQHPSGNSMDQQINDYALPVLVQRTLDVQSSQIDMVSGATVTSMGYLQSLQAALDSAGI